jgi:hypothetical protein
MLTILLTLRLHHHTSSLPSYFVTTLLHCYLLTLSPPYCCLTWFFSKFVSSIYLMASCSWSCSHSGSIAILCHCLTVTILHHCITVALLRRHITVALLHHCLTLTEKSLGENGELRHIRCSFKGFTYLTTSCHRITQTPCERHFVCAPWLCHSELVLSYVFEIF